jgi:hypothetical protein
VRWIRQPQTDLEIVGVVRAIRHRGPAEAARETVYRPFTQYARASMFFVVKSAPHGHVSAATLRSAIGSVDRSQPLADVHSMQERLDRSLLTARTSLVLAGTLAGIALTLAGVGLYGLLSFGVAQRVREFGVRMALGASPFAVGRLVMAEGLALTSGGAAMGVGVAALIALSARALLYEASIIDPRLYLIGVCLVLMGAGVALWIPARRASETDPQINLRAD